MRLTAPRARILEALVAYAHLSTAQFYALFRATDEASQRALRRVLHDFTRLGFLRRARLVLDGRGDTRLPQWEFLYWLSRKGLALARDEGLDPKGIGKASDGRSPFMLAHEHAITEFHLQVNRAAGEEVWWRQAGLKHDFNSVGARSGVAPDALFYLAGYYHFLEIERSKQGHYRNGESGLLKKLRGYLAYARSGAFKERWPEMQGFFVLVVVGSAARERNLLKALAARAPHALFRVTTAEWCRPDVLGPIWKCPRDYAQGKRYSLQVP